MTAVRALLDPKTLSSTRRTATRRKLRLHAEGSASSGTAEVLILDISTTGLLLETAADLVKGETIELDLPEAVGVRAVVKWTSGRLFGCQFRDPLSNASVSSALLRAPFETSRSAEAAAPSKTFEADDDLEDSVLEHELTFSVKLRWIVGLALLSWAFVAATVSLAWRYLN